MPLGDGAGGGGASFLYQSSGAVSWAFRPNEPYGFYGRKATLNRASALVTICP